MKPWKFIHVTDIHVGSPRSFRFEPAYNENWQTARKQIIEIQPDLLLIGGDLTRDGSLHRYELEAIKNDLDTLPFPYYVVPGNMDTGNKHTDVQGALPLDRRDDVSLNIRSEQLNQFASVFGTTQWSFVHKNVRFSGFCDMLAGSGLPEEKDLWEWMKSQKEQARAKHHIWIMHYALFMDDLDEPNFDIQDPSHYNDWYFGVDEPHRSRIMKHFKETNTNLVISGHVHCRRSRLAKGIRFNIGPSTAFPQSKNRWPDGDASLGFLRCDVMEKGIRSSYVPLRTTSQAEGYGPRGHPPPEKRDYSLAWEK